MNKEYYFKKRNNKYENNKVKNIIDYKDIFIILSLWYLIQFLTKIINQITITNYSPQLEGLLSYLIFFSGRFIFIALSLFYFISLYDLTLADLKLSLKINFKLLLQLLLLMTILSGIVIFLINIPLSFNHINLKKFCPLYFIKTPNIFVNSIFTSALFFPANTIIALSEVFLIVVIIRNYLNKFLKNNISILISSIIYPFLIFNIPSTIIIQYFILSYIYFFIFKKTDNIITAAALGGSFYTILIVYIYGCNFIIST